MTSKIKQVVLVFIAFFVVFVALLGVLKIFDVITASELADYSSKVGIAVLVIAVASALVSFLLTVDKKP